MNQTMLIRLHSIPIYQQIVSRTNKSQSRLKIGKKALTHLFDVTNCTQHRKYRFNHHSHIPTALFTNQQAVGIACFSVKTAIGQNNHFTVELPQKILEASVADIGAVANPAHNPTILVQNQTEFT